MKFERILTVLLAIMMLLGCAAAENEPESPAAVLSFPANETTGFSWSAMILSGESVRVGEPVYIPDANPENLTGVGGHTEFALNAAEPGQTLIAFTYSRPWEDGSAETKLVLAYVDSNMTLTTADITDQGILEGIVSSVDAEAHSALLTLVSGDEAEAIFPGDMALPVQGEHVVLYTDGTMTMSLPGIVNVLAWESVPDENARSGDETLPALPPYVCRSDDPIEAATADYTAWLGGRFLQEDGSVAVPAPLIFKTVQTDDEHVNVYGDFWVFNYRPEGDVLLCISGGAFPGMLTLLKTEDGWTPAGLTEAEDGEGLWDSILAICAGDKELEEQYLSEDELLTPVREAFLRAYITENNLPYTAYQDEGWDSVPLFEGQ